MPGDYRSVIGFAVVIAPLIFVWQWAGATARPAEFRSEQRLLMERWDPEDSIRNVVVGLLSVAATFLLTGLPGLAAKSARCAAAGHGMVLGLKTPGSAFGYGRMVLLGVRAESVKPVWRSGTMPKGAMGRRLLLVGQANGVFVLWDIDAQRTVRVAAGDNIVVRGVRSTSSSCEREVH